MNNKNILFGLLAIVIASTGYSGIAYGALSTATSIDTITVNTNDSIDLVCTDPTFDAGEALEGREVLIDNDAGFGSPEVTVGGSADLVTLTCDGVATNNISFSGSYSDGDTINVQLTVYDDGNIDSVATDTFVVADNTAPVITLTGSTPVTIELNVDTYTELGATALDNIDGDISGSVVTAGDTVDESTIGAYVVTYDVDDSAGNSATQVTRTVNVVDTTDPVITLTGSTPVTIELNVDTYTELGATVTDNDPATSGTATVGGDTVDESTIGVYVVTYDVDDPTGNSATQVTRTVNVVDTTDPVITLTGSTPVSIVKDVDTYTELGATVTDNDPATSGTATVGGDTVDESTIGVYVVTYDVDDPTGNSATQVTRTVNVIAGGIPVITLTGSTPVTIELNVDTYTELGATASDAEDGDISGSVVTAGDTVDESTIGAYVVTYDVDDSSGNSATQVTRTVNVVDTTDPVITLTGSTPVSIVKDVDTYTELGATVTDNDPATSGTATVGGDTVDESTIGVYVVTYDVDDPTGNSATQVTRTVNVIAGGTPTLTLTGTTPVSIVKDVDTYTELGATASDPEEGDISGSVVVGGDTVDESTIGVYVVTYDVDDSSGNSAVQITRTVNVIAGGTPVITVTGGDTSVAYRATYSDAGATCADPEDGAIAVTTVNPVDTLVSGGSFVVTYDCTDSSGNDAVQATRNVTVDLRPNGSGDDKHKTAPTSGLDWKTFRPLVEDGVVVNGIAHNVIDNWHTDFAKQIIPVGLANEFSVKTYAQNGGLLVQEIAFGIPEVGYYNDAESMVEVWYNYDKSIDKVVVVQKTEVIDVDALKVTTEQVACVEGDSQQCYKTSFDNVIFNEPLQHDVFAVKSIDNSRRTMQPTYLNDGVDVLGESINTMPTKQIAGNIRHEGLVTVTQLEKYSDLWATDDGRIFEMFGISESFKLVFTPESEHKSDSGEIKDRYHDAFNELKLYQAELAKYNVFNSAEIQSVLPESKSIEYPENDSRTQFLIDNNLLDFVRG